MGKRILYIVGCVLVAHVIASYICVWVTVMRVSDLNERFGSTKYTIPAYMRVQAPVRVFSMLNRLQYENVDSPKGRAVLWGAYAGSLVLIAGVLVIAPRWLFVDEDRSRSMYAGKKGR